MKMMIKKENKFFDVTKVLSEDFDDYVIEKEERRQKWKERKKNDQ